MGIDQSPYFRVSADVAERLNYPKCAEIHSEFIPSLGGIQEKMSSSSGSIPPIFLTDTPAEIESKIKKSFSGGKDTKADQLRYGSNLNTDVPYQYLLYYLDDDTQLSEIAHKYRSGLMMTNEVKKILTDILVQFVADHQQRRNAVTDEILKLYFSCNREFDHSRVPRDQIQLNTDEEYSHMGVNFDRKFGAVAPAGAQEIEEEIIRKLVEACQNK